MSAAHAFELELVLLFALGAVFGMCSALLVFLLHRGGHQ